MKPLVKKSILTLALALVLFSTSLVSIYVSVWTSREIANSNTMLLMYSHDLMTYGYNISKSTYEFKESDVLLSFYWEFERNLNEKNITDVYYQGSYHAFPTTIVYAKVWFIAEEIQYVLTLVPVA